MSTDPESFLVEIRIRPGNNIKVFIDADKGMSIEKLAQYNRSLYKQLEESVFFPNGDFSLEVSSPGLDRVLRKNEDYVRFAGEKARLKLRLAMDGQRNFVGTLRAVNDGKLELEVDGKLLALDLGNIEKARLVPNI